MEKIQFHGTDGEDTAELYVLEQVRIGGCDYILVTDSEEDDAQAWILKDLSSPEDEQACYETVDDEEEFAAVSKVFAEELDDVKFE